MKLTIGMCCYDDYDGVYFTIQAIRMYHKEVLKDCEFIIVNNNPNSNSGQTTNKLKNWIQEPCQIINFTDYQSTSCRNKIFEYCNTPYCLSTDCHVLFESGSLKKLIKFFDSGKDQGNLLQGPLLYDNMQGISTHFELEWRGNMWGTWATDSRGIDPQNEPFEIPSQGLGVFACRTNNWLGFNPSFRGFGGEEGYIHEKYRRMGKKTLCLPFLRWLHRFDRPNGVPYPLTLDSRIRNYLIGFTELGMDIQPIKDHFKDKFPQQRMDELLRSLHIL